MIEALADALLAYACGGILFASAFVSLWVTRLDPVARDSSIAFRLLIFPGAAALWPYLLKRMIGEWKRK